MATPTKSYKPAEMSTLSPHLVCANAPAAMEFYKKAFGAKELARLPGPDGKLMHGAVLICGASVMLVDENRAWNSLGPLALQGTPVTLHLYVEDADAFFAQAVKAGAQPIMPVAEMFWGDRYGVLKDPFGHRWSIATHVKDLSPQEIQSGMQAAFAAHAQSPGCAAENAEKATFAISREFDVPRALLWQVFTDAEHLKQWWGPKGFKVIAAKLDLRPGGTFHYGMHTPDGAEMWGRFVYREIKAPEHLVFVNSFSDAKGGTTRHPMAPTWPLEMLSRFEFAEAGKKSRFTVTWAPLNPTPEEKATFEAGQDSMRQGWTGTLDQLAAYLAKIHKPAQKSSKARG